VEEWEVPYRVLHYEFLPDSAGAGQWRGGLGTHVKMLNTYDSEVWQPLDCVVMTGNSDGEKFGALGTMGGTEGTKSQLGILRGGKPVQLRCNDVQYLEPGDVVWTKSGGGGGVGNPLDRDVEQVRWDVLNEYISLDTAKEVYGVVIDPETLELDRNATTELRRKLGNSTGG
jgi:N-methylhydantoinase B